MAQGALWAFEILIRTGGLYVLIDAVRAKSLVTLFSVFFSQRICVIAKVSSG